METNKLYGKGFTVIHRNVHGEHILALDENGHSRCWCHPYEYESDDEHNAMKLLFMVARSAGAGAMDDFSGR